MISLYKHLTMIFRIFYSRNAMVTESCLRVTLQQVKIRITFWTSHKLFETKNKDGSPKSAKNSEPRLTRLHLLHKEPSPMNKSSAMGESERVWHCRGDSLWSKAIRQFVHPKAARISHSSCSGTEYCTRLQFIALLIIKPDLVWYSFIFQFGLDSD